MKRCYRCKDEIHPGERTLGRAVFGKDYKPHLCIQCNVVRD